MRPTANLEQPEPDQPWKETALSCLEDVVKKLTSPEELVANGGTNEGSGFSSGLTQLGHSFFRGVILLALVTLLAPGA